MLQLHRIDQQPFRRCLIIVLIANKSNLQCQCKLFFFVFTNMKPLINSLLFPHRYKVPIGYHPAEQVSEETTYVCKVNRLNCRMIVQVEKVLTCLQWNRDLIWANKTCTQWNSLLSSTILTCCITCTLDHCCCCCCWLLLLIVDCLFVTGFCGRSQLTCVIEVISRAWLCRKVNHSIFIFIIIIVTWLMFTIH